MADFTIGPRQAALVEEITDEAFNQWLHSPITGMFFQFLRDQRLAWREQATDMWENGLFRNHDGHPDRNPDVVRGRVLAFGELAEIRISGIKDFYQQLEADSQDQ